MTRINNCDRCDGYGWLWWHELEDYDGPAWNTANDDTKYTCDACQGEPITEVTMESFDPVI